MHCSHIDSLVSGPKHPKMHLPWLRAAVSLLALLSVAPRVKGYYEYQAKIPNGARVPHPCKPNFLWHGVGHFNVPGGGSRNQFGLDFVAAGWTWTAELCRKDSDGDGKSNGEELGDPQCIWTPGQIPQFTSGITHPGVCEPFREAVCSNKAVPHSAGLSYTTVGEWMEEACSMVEFECPAIDNEGAQPLDFRLPVTPVPATHTTYMCMTFEWPDVTQDFHVIATQPIINNSYVMHHMLLFGCPDEFPAVHSPWECGMGECQELVSLWTLGFLGHCFHKDAGFHVGKTGFRKFMIQFHWNNPHLNSNFMDSSGMRLYYTSRLRPYNMAMLMIGQEFIHIPPRSPDTLVTSECTSTCTRNLLTDDIQVTSVVNHMHYLGMSMNIELHRSGRFLRNITNDPIYNYDIPNFYEFPDAVTVKPGDMIRTNCHYSSLHKTTTTFWGPATSDEMCYGLLAFYPKENMPISIYCLSWKGHMECDNNTFGGCTSKQRAIFSSPSFSETDLFQNITSVCRPFGVCTEECKSAIRTARKNDPCLSNEDLWNRIQWYSLPRTEAGLKFSACMASCETELYAESLNHSDSSVCPGGSASNDAGGVTVVRSSASVLTSLVGLASGTLCLTLLSC